MAVPLKVEIVAHADGDIITTLDTADFSDRAFDLMMSGLYRKVDFERCFIREIREGE